MVDPEFWLDEEITSLGFEFRLFYIGTWNFADDYGVVENSAKKLKAQVFPYDDVDCEEMITKLIKLGKFVEFEAEGRKWLFIKKFLKYQRVDKPSRNRNPQAPKHIIGEDSTTTQEPLHDEVKLSKVKLSKEKEIELPVWLNKKAWDALVQHRKEIKKPLTSQAIKLIIKKLESHKEDHVQMIKNSIENRWTTIYPLKKDEKRVSTFHKIAQEAEDSNQRMRDKQDNENLKILLEQSKKLTEKMTLI